MKTIIIFQTLELLGSYERITRPLPFARRSMIKGRAFQSDVLECAFTGYRDGRYKVIDSVL